MNGIFWDLGGDREYSLLLLYTCKHIPDQYCMYVGSLGSLCSLGYCIIIIVYM
jgi:hypothetical protein